MRFVLLVLGLLGGSLVCLLVINTTLGAAGFRISQLQKTSLRLSTEEQDLRQQVAAEQAPATIAKRAYELGMRARQDTVILDLRTHQIYQLPGQAGVGVELGAPPPPTASPTVSPTASPTASPAGTTTPAAGPTPASPKPSATSPAATASPSAASTPSPARSSP